MNASDIIKHCSWQDLLPTVERVDCLIVDAPYSEKTHAGHGAGKQTSDRAMAWAKRQAKTGNQDHNDRVAHALRGAADRADLDYAAWSANDVDAFVDAWSERVGGWMVSLTDHVLASSWESAMRINDRYTFAPIPFVAPGSRVRLTGDGPSCWCCWIVVSRPKHRPFSSWGSLPGGYVLPTGKVVTSGPRDKRLQVTGGKPLWLMSRLVEDYSRPDDLVCDPCAGAGTTLVAALRAGRRAIGCDSKAEHAEIARQWVQAELDNSTLAESRRGQLPLLAGAQ